MPMQKPVTFEVDERGCHVCTSHSYDNNGYPRINRRAYGMVPTRISRVVFEETYGPVPFRMEVCHSCDNPACINPEHLFLGSHADNMADMIRKKRAKHPPLCGEANGLAKLTEPMVRAIRDDNRQTSQVLLARRYGVTQTAISLVLCGKSWKHFHEVEARKC